MEFLKIITQDQRQVFVARDKIITFQELESTDETSFLKIETLENRQFVAVGTKEEIGDLIHSICKLEPTPFE
jgi:hypothetical protein